MPHHLHLLAVGTWAFSPIKFQADMGILLAFMCAWNMVGARVRLPVLGVSLLRGPAREPTLHLKAKHGPA